VAVELKLERFSEEMEYATVSRWLKREGETVTEGEPIVEVEAEKANHELDAPASGLLESILAVEGDEFRVGDTLATIAESG
jgi:pyruvate/2-oxoglutarate dehydrogenase complex dihydrolipoamide acyltransferase (E2) component